MLCPICGAISKFDFSSCPHCGYKMELGTEQPLPNWRQLPGFRSKTLSKMIISAIIYIWIVLAIIASLFNSF